jgi:hypothetical protein
MAYHPRTWRPILGGLGGVAVPKGLMEDIWMSYGAAGTPGPPPRTWYTYDCTQIGIPADAVCVDLTGILIITGGSAWDAWPGIMVAFREPGDTSVGLGRYVGQAMGNRAGNGDRTNMAYTTTLVGGKFEWAWDYNDYPVGWPSYPSIGMNLTIVRWMK